MDQIPGTADTVPDGGIDSRLASAPPDKAAQQASRGFTPLILLWTFRAVEILVVCGSFWL